MEWETGEKRLLRGYLFFYMLGELDEQGSAHGPEAWWPGAQGAPRGALTTTWTQGGAGNHQILTTGGGEAKTNEGKLSQSASLFHVAVLGPGAGHTVQVEARRPRQVRHF